MGAMDTFWSYDGETTHYLQQREEERQQRQQEQAKVWYIVSLAYRILFVAASFWDLHFTAV